MNKLLDDDGNKFIIGKVSSRIWLVRLSSNDELIFSNYLVNQITNYFGQTNNDSTKIRNVIIKYIGKGLLSYKRKGKVI